MKEVVNELNARTVDDYILAWKSKIVSGLIDNTSGPWDTQQFTPGLVHMIVSRFA